MTTSTPKTSTTHPGVWPTLSYRDAEAALRYLVDVVGFTESVVHRGDADRPISHAELLWPDGGGIMFGSEPHGRAVVRRGRRTGTLDRLPVHATTWTASPQRVTAAGWKVLRPLDETDYGSREFAFLDPEGNAWSVGTYRGAQA